MADKVKHMERSRRSNRDQEYRKRSGLTRMATVSQKKQTIFSRFKESLLHRKQPQQKGEI